MSLDAAKVQEAIRSALEATANGELIKADDIAFHMTDWLDDLDRYYRFCENPGGYRPEEVEGLLMEILVHVPNHVAAAAKLLVDMPVSDVFGVGAVETGDNPPAR